MPRALAPAFLLGALCLCACPSRPAPPAPAPAPAPPPVAPPPPLRDAAPAPPPPRDAAVVSARDAGVEGLRVLFVTPASTVDLGESFLFVPMVCFDGATREVLSTARCAPRLTLGGSVRFEDGAEARFASRRLAPCNYHFDADEHGWHPTPDDRGQPGAVFDHATRALGTYALWPSGALQSLPAPNGDGTDLFSYESLPRATQRAVLAARHIPASLTPELRQQAQADLDGDGLRETLLALVYRTRPATEEEAPPPENMVCVVSGTDLGEVRCFDTGGLTMPRVAAVLDFDGSGPLELLLDVPGNDMQSYVLLRLEGGEWRSLGSSSCDDDATPAPGSARASRPRR